MHIFSGSFSDNYVYVFHKKFHTISTQTNEQTRHLKSTSLYGGSPKISGSKAGVAAPSMGGEWRISERFLNEKPLKASHSCVPKKMVFIGFHRVLEMGGKIFLFCHFFGGGGRYFGIRFKSRMFW